MPAIHVAVCVEPMWMALLSVTTPMLPMSMLLLSVPV
jgi:hypothetical protein